MKQRHDGSIYIPVQPPATLGTDGKANLTLLSRPGERDTSGELQWLHAGPLDLEMGGRLEEVTIAYRTWGQLNEARDNAVFVLHALTGDSNAAGQGGWWGPVIGPGKPIDTDRAFVICANILGGCQGTTGPASIDPLTNRSYGMRFPLITIGDMISAHRLVVAALGIDRITLAGGSIGGCQALEWATRYPDEVAATIAIGATPSLGPQAIALLEAGRRAVMADPDWRGGEYAAEGTFPGDGLAIARMIMMAQFHSAESMDARFARKPAARPTLYPAFGSTFDVEGYIHYHGAALVRRFDANSHLYLTRAMDHFDLYRDGGKERWLDQINSPIRLVGIRSDWLYPPEPIRQLAADLVGLGKPADYVELDSPNGHDAFLKDWDLMDDAMRPFMDQVLPARQHHLIDADERGERTT